MHALAHAELKVDDRSITYESVTIYLPRRAAMSSRKSRQRKRSNTSPRSPRPSDAKRKSASGKESAEWWHRPAVWITGLVTALFIAIASALGTGIGNKLFSAVDGKIASSRPVEIESISYIKEEGGSVVAFRRPLTEAQVAKLTNTAEVLSADSSVYNRYLSMVSGYGGATTGDVFVKIVLRGNSQQPVAITGIQAIKKCGQPLDGTLLYSPTQGSIGNIPIGFNLDQPYSYAQSWNTQTDVFSGNYFNSHTITLSQGEIVPLILGAETERQSCRFSLLLTVDDGTRTVTEGVAPSAGSFAVTAGEWTFNGKQITPIRFDNYKEMYVGGVASSNANGKYMQVNPKQYIWG
jgi:hypothetical protein